MLTRPPFWRRWLMLGWRRLGGMGVARSVTVIGCGLIVVLMCACLPLGVLLSPPTAPHTPAPGVAEATLVPTRTPAAPRPTRTARPTATPTATVALLPATVTGQVVSVIDGDTLEVDIAGVTYPLRLIGIEAPEQADACGDTAVQALTQLVAEQALRLERDVSETDRFDRLLRYVYVGDVFVNAELIRLGVAEARRYPPDTGQSRVLETAETEARQSLPGCYGQGVFGGVSAVAVTADTRASGPVEVAPQRIDPAPATLAPTPAPLPTTEAPTLEPPTAVPTVVEPPTAAPPTEAPPPANCDSSYPTVCIPPPPPDLDCGGISYRRFQVVGADPHRFDGDNDGVGCESD